MSSSQRQRKVDTKGKSDFPADFFSSLQRGDVDDAVRAMSAAAISESGETSPRAKSLMESGEWDQKQLLSLVLVESNACLGRIGNDDHRFCGRPGPSCHVAAHTKNALNVKPQRGWYISFGKGVGVMTQPFLPTNEDGGPINAAIAARLTSSTNPFRLTRGQWKFVIDEWHASRVEVMSEASDEVTIEFQNLDSKKQPYTTQQMTSTTSTARNESSNTEEYEQTDVKELAVYRVKVNTQAIELLRQQEALTRLNDLVQELSKRNQELRDQHERSEENMQRLEAYVRRISTRHERDVTEQASRMNDIHEKIEEFEDKIAAHQYSNGKATEDYDADPNLIDKVERLDVAMFSTTGAFSRFKESFIEFKDQVESGGGLECNSVSFKSYHNFMAWFNKYKPTVDIFLDAHAFLHAIRAPVVHTDDATKQLELQMKTSIATGLEAAVLSSFETIVPSVLVGSSKGNGSAGCTYDWLAGYLKSFETWKPLGSNNGVSHQISNGIANVSKRISELRKQYSHNDITGLSMGLCQDSAKFCHALVRFINDQQEELTNNTSYTEEQIWKMQLECIQKIVEELSQAREAYADCGRTARGNLVWGMLMSWQIQKRYIANNFKDDPALTGVLVRRILMQGQDSSIKKKMAKLDALESKISENKNYVTNELGKVKGEMTKLKEEVSKLKK